MKKLSISGKSEDIIAIPLGGCGQMGKNLMLYCHKGTWIMIDCGASFGDDRITPGVDIIVPDISFLRDNKIKISAIILTHVHEDHVGSVSHFIEELNCPVYSTKFGLEFLQLRLKDRGVAIKGKMFKEMLNADFQIGNFIISPVFITHSIPEMHGIFISTEKVKIFHTGDWKFDDTPVVGQQTDLERIQKLSQNVTLMLCDSTNVLSEGRSQSEGELEHSLYNIISDKKGMVIVTTFASNVARIQTLCNIARRTNRTISLCGLSLGKITAISKKTGYLKGEEFLDAKDAMKLPKKEILMICTGCQGEPLASVAKISNNSHPIVRVSKNDTVIFSSKIIPGNEKKILATLNRFADNDIDVITEREHFVHVSGHPKRDELREMYKLVKPKFAIPVHGDSVNLRNHVEFIESEKLAEKAFFIKDGDVMIVNQNEIKKAGTIKADFMCVDGKTYLSPSSNAMRDRRKLKDNGLISCSIVVAKDSKSLLSLQIKNIGILDENDEYTKKIISMTENNAKSNILAILKFLKSKKINANEQILINKKISETTKSLISKIISSKFEKSPVVSIAIHFI